MEKVLKMSLGIDVSSDKFDFVLSTIDQHQKVKTKASRKFNRNERKQMLTWIEKKRIDNVLLVITLEATGVYHEELAWMLHLDGYRVSVVLPNLAKKYLESTGLKSKNDKIDAKGLAQMGAERSLKEWKPISKEIYNLKILTRQHESLQEEKSRLRAQLHARSVSRVKSSLVERQLKSSIKFIDKQIKEVINAIDQILQKDHLLRERVEKITKIKGLANLTVITIIAETNGFEDFFNQKQLTSYAGYDVVENSSGKRIGKTKISKKGNAHIRRILHLASINAVRYQKGEFEALYERVYAKSGIKMKGLVAVQRKLLGLIFTLYRNNQEYDPLYHKKLANQFNSLPALGELQINQSSLS